MTQHQHLIIRGLPRALAADSWWFSDAPAPTPPPPPTGRKTLDRDSLRGIGVLFVLILAGDLLFWGKLPGLSLALFAGLIFAGAVALRPTDVAPMRPALLLLVAALPVVEYPQPLSLALLLTGLLAAIAWLDVAQTGAILRAALHRLIWLPFAGARDLLHLFIDRRLPAFAPGRARALLTGWALPCGGALILVALLLMSNPVFDGWPDGLTPLSLDPARLALWSGLGLVIWPFLTKSSLLEPNLVSLPARPDAWNGPAVRRALVIFNLLLLVQTGMDAAYLWTGAPLPDGVTLAEYAHRGAYPLLVTALLAGVFAAAARPFTHLPGLRALLLIWLAQNVMLTGGALLRLDLYVGEFGLTYLRLHTAVWMAVVILGLSLTAWQVARERSTPWLLIRCAALGLGTLYIASFVNFGAMIVAHNTGRADVDTAYHCTLPPVARPTLMCGGGLAIDQWQSWNFRTHRAIGIRDAVYAGGVK